MLGKLIKYEFKHTSKNMLLLFLILIIITPFTALYSRYFVNNLVDAYEYLAPIFTTLEIAAVGIYSISVIAVAVITIVLIIMRFYKSMVSDEGYLTHTLPVSEESLVFSKLLVAFVWSIVSSIVIVISVFIFLLIMGVITWDQIDFKAIIDFFSLSGITFGEVCLYLGAIIFSTIAKILSVYFSIAIGHKLRNHPVLGAIVAYFCLNIVLSVIGSIFSAISFMRIGFDDSEFTFLQYMDSTMIFGNVISIIQIVVFFIVTVYIFKKKLDI